MASYAELYIDQGANFTESLTLADDITNASMNLVNYSASGQLRTSYYTANASANLVCFFSDASNGVMNISLTSSNTSNLRAGRYVFDIKLTDPNSITSRIIEGIAIVSPGTTR